MDTADIALLIASAAALISLVAAIFSGWQAYGADQTRKSENERGLVEWEPATWPEPEVVELRSMGPDDAREVWARMTIKGRTVEEKAKHIRKGDVLRFTFPELSADWQTFELLRAGHGEQWRDLSVFEWGAVTTWQSRYGKPAEHRQSGVMRMQVRADPELPRLGDPSPGMPI